MLYNQNVDKYKILEVDIMAKFSYQPKGVCSVQIDFEVEDGVVRNVHTLTLSKEQAVSMKNWWSEF